MQRLTITIFTLSFLFFGCAKAQNKDNTLERIHRVTDSVAYTIVKKEAPPIGLTASNSNGTSRLSGA